MDIQFFKTEQTDYPTIVEVRNACFLRDFETFGYCPAYNLSLEDIKKKAEKMNFYNIVGDGKIIGNITYCKESKNMYFIGCMCVLPKYENLRVGTNALKYVEGLLPSGATIYLITPLAKKKNIHFYEKNGYKIVEQYMDKNIQVVKFEKVL